MTNYESAIEKAGRLKTTLATMGWQDIEALMKNKRADYVKAALSEKDINKIYYAQACVEAIDYLKSEIEALINAGEEAEKISKKKK